MGVPRLFRWLLERYPMAVTPVQSSKGLPHIDFFYLDTNGLLHQAVQTLREAGLAVDEQEVFRITCAAIDELVLLVRPTRLIYVALDGVAPRAKMNQQRSRRFFAVHTNKSPTAAVEAADAEEADAGAGAGAATDADTPAGGHASVPAVITPDFDSNAITPGTEFMGRAAAHIQYYLEHQLENNPAWATLAVVLSTTATPGEGEHKLLDFIRGGAYASWAAPSTTPSTVPPTHCIYGLDADLVILALATHDPHIVLLREVNTRRKIFPFHPQPLMRTHRSMSGYELYWLSILREYLDLEYSAVFAAAAATSKLTYNFESVLDDLVLLFTLVGNDFVPGLPTLEIREGGLNNILNAYKKVIVTLDGYLTQVDATSDAIVAGATTPVCGIWFERFEAVLKALAAEEAGAMTSILDGIHSLTSPVVSPDVVALESNWEFDDDEAVAEDPQYALDYYSSKFGITAADSSARRRVTEEYAVAVAWIFQYYMSGVPSWTWFFPYHYPPLLSDLVNLSSAAHAGMRRYSSSSSRFDAQQPLPPLYQLLCVLPPESAALLPQAWQQLVAPTSPIADYFPPTEKLQVDARDKVNDWEAVVLLPFIDQHRLMAATQPLLLSLSPADVKRNVLVEPLLLFRNRTGAQSPTVSQASLTLAPPAWVSVLGHMEHSHVCTLRSSNTQMPSLVLAVAPPVLPFPFCMFATPSIMCPVRAVTKVLSNTYAPVNRLGWFRGQSPPATAQLGWPSLVRYGFRFEGLKVAGVELLQMRSMRESVVLRLLVPGVDDVPPSTASTDLAATGTAAATADDAETKGAEEDDVAVRSLPPIDAETAASLGLPIDVLGCVGVVGCTPLYTEVMVIGVSTVAASGFVPTLGIANLPVNTATSTPTPVYQQQDPAHPDKFISRRRTCLRSIARGCAVHMDDAAGDVMLRVAPIIGVWTSPSGDISLRFGNTFDVPRMLLMQQVPIAAADFSTQVLAKDSKFSQVPHSVCTMVALLRQQKHARPASAPIAWPVITATAQAAATAAAGSVSSETSRLWTETAALVHDKFGALLTTAQAASQLGMPAVMFEHVVRSAIVECSSTRLEAGLEMFSVKGSFFRPRYCVSVGNEWLFWPAAVEAVREYQATFPGLFAALGTGSRLRIRQVLSLAPGGPAETDATVDWTPLETQFITAVKLWKSQHFLGYRQETMGLKFRTCKLPAKEVNSVLTACPPLAGGALGHVHPVPQPTGWLESRVDTAGAVPHVSVGSRVVYARYDGAVPFGLCGVVVGLGPRTTCWNFRELPSVPKRADAAATAAARQAAAELSSDMEVDVLWLQQVVQGQSVAEGPVERRISSVSASALSCIE